MTKNKMFNINNSLSGKHSERQGKIGRMLKTAEQGLSYLKIPLRMIFDSQCYELVVVINSEQANREKHQPTALK